MTITSPLPPVDRSSAYAGPRGSIEQPQPMPRRPVEQDRAIAATYYQHTQPTTGPGLDQVRYWTGAGITAAIAALAGVAGLTAATIAHVKVLVGSGLAPVHVVAYGLIAAAVALAAAGLYNAMLHLAPRPTTYYSWLVGMVTVLGVLLPFTSAAPLHSQMSLAGVNLLVGVIVLLLVPLAAVHARSER